jgi:hypothetical protein
VKLDIKADFLVKVEDKEARAHSSPTDQLRRDLMYSFAGDATKPLIIDKLVLVDDTGAERLSNN